MTELARRSGSQILRTFLPQQTADLGSRIYRVKEWTGARSLIVDADVVRRRLLRALTPWSRNGQDGGLAAELQHAADIEILALDNKRGVEVERWPNVWLCRDCRRIGKDLQKACRCGSRKWGQLHFVGFHTCGAIVEPWIKRCATHDDVKLVSPKSSQARDIRFVCPTCNAEIMKGLGFKQCICGDGPVSWNVHKARSVYAPRSLVLVNPPRPERMRELLASGGARRALAWVLDGMTALGPASTATGITRGAFVEDLIQNKGMSRELAEKMAALADEAGELADDHGDSDVDEITGAFRQEAENEAVDLAMGVAEARLLTADLANLYAEDTLTSRILTDYPAALSRAGVDGVDLIDRFPVLNAAFGYTRGGGEPGENRLVAFRNPRGGYRLYGEQADTEAFLVRLNPVLVLDWLRSQGHSFTAGDNTSARTARVAILKRAVVPGAGESTPGMLGSDLLTLIHSYAHRLIRQTAVFAGIDRDALAEYLIPAHLSFFIYGAARGDFVLGGLQAVFESDLDRLFNNVVDAEHRCPLDPGCTRGSGACVGCLHLGEPSCRYYNADLSRKALFGPLGYLRRVRAGSVATNPP